MLRPYLRIWEGERNFGRSVKAFFSPGVRSPWSCLIFSDNINLIDLIDSIDLSLRCSNVQFRIWQLPGGAFKSEISGKMTLSDISLCNGIIKSIGNMTDPHSADFDEKVHKPQS